MWPDASSWLQRHIVFLLFLTILISGLYIRFYPVQQTAALGLDQGRDAWAVYDIVSGKHSLKGPRTGVGDFYLGPAYFYILTPFYQLANMDPLGAVYFNITATSLTFFIIFYVTKKILGNRAGLFATILFASCAYIVFNNRVPWNVSLLPGTAYLIFYCTFKIYQGSKNWYAPLLFLTGFLFHIHFTAIFVLPIIGYLILITKNKKVNLKAFLLCLPLFFIWFIPTVVFDALHYNDNYYRFRGFLTDYTMGFHLQFLIHRLSDNFIQVSALFQKPISDYARYLVPLLFIAAIFTEKIKRVKSLLLLIPPWYIVPLIGFSLYKGPISDYYFFINQPLGILMTVYLSVRLLRKKSTIISMIVLTLWIAYVFSNIKIISEKPKESKTLNDQKESVRNIIASHDKVEYNEGNISSYLYFLWTKKDNGKK